MCLVCFLGVHYGLGELCFIMYPAWMSFLQHFRMYSSIATFLVTCLHPPICCLSHSTCPFDGFMTLMMLAVTGRNGDDTHYQADGQIPPQHPWGQL